MSARRAGRCEGLPISADRGDLHARWEAEKVLALRVAVWSSVTLRDEIESIDLNKAFAEAFAAGATDHTFQVKDHTFRMRGLRLYSPYENLHRLMYAANSREVRTEKIDKVIPNLQSRLTDTIGPFVYLGFIEGDYLDKTANGERTDFSIPSGDDDDNVVGEITIRDIRADAVESVRRDLAPFLEEINREK